MATRSPRERMMLIIGIPLVLIILAWNFLNPAGGAAAQKGALSTADAQKKLTETKAEITKMRLDQETMDPKIDKMSYSIPAEQLVPRVIRDIQRIADQNGVHLREIKPIRGKKLKSNAGVRVPIEVRFTSKFQPTAMHFLVRVEEVDSRMVVDKINITSADPRFTTVDVSATITVFTTSLTGFTGGEGENSNATNKTTRG